MPAAPLVRTGISISPFAQCPLSGAVPLPVAPARPPAQAAQAFRPLSLFRWQFFVFGKSVENRILGDEMKHVSRIETKPLLDDLPEGVGRGIKSANFIDHLLDPVT